MSRRTARIEANENAGRDFVVGDTHGEFETLEALLERIEFAPGRDRLFALGDLIDRGPRSADARTWLEEGRITLSVRGNHEQMLDDRIRIALGAFNDRGPWMMHPWFARDVRHEDWLRWRDVIAAMPIAATVQTAAGDIGLIHARPTARSWRTTLRKLGAGDNDSIETALWSTARAHERRMAAVREGVPIDGPITGVRSVLTGHAILKKPTTTANVWHIDTGAGRPHGHLTVARIDTDPIRTTTIPVQREATYSEVEARAEAVRRLLRIVDKEADDPQAP